MCLVYDGLLNHVHMFNHLEYDSDTLDNEYRRDITRGEDIGLPGNYYPSDNPANPPVNSWRSSSHILYGNWLNMIYQTTPYNIDKIGTHSDHGADTLAGNFGSRL